MFLSFLIKSSTRGDKPKEARSILNAPVLNIALLKSRRILSILQEFPEAILFAKMRHGVPDDETLHRVLDNRKKFPGATRVLFGCRFFERHDVDLLLGQDSLRNVERNVIEFPDATHILAKYPYPFDFRRRLSVLQEGVS